ncbi:MAG: hypothetical protein WA077_00380, partial [Anaerolineae bacterium]
MMRDDLCRRGRGAKWATARQTAAMAHLGLVMMVAVALFGLTACGGRATPVSDLRIELRTGAGSVQTG